ncbi:methyltransferase-like protein 5-like protein [Cladochytrium replicatum]|nr:methyltransferase-like protein 5-like protein [Cladochytrium replicatum]
MRLKDVESLLQQCGTFDKPKIQFEQYPTSPHIAARLLHTAQSSFEDIESCTVVDLGVGCGVLSVGAAALDAGHVIGIDIDEDALAKAQSNVDELEVGVDLLRMDVVSQLPELRLGDGVLEDEEARNQWRFTADTVIMNPPFGTKTVKGVDLMFLNRAFQIAETAVYSLHKSSTRNFIIKKAAEWGWKGEVVAELRYDIPNMYKFHKQKSVDIEVDFLRFSK